MSKNTLRVIGLTLLVPSVLLGLLPLAVANTDIATAWNSFTLSFGNFTVARYDASLGRHGMFVSLGVWAAAAIGELFVILAHFTPSKRQSRYTLSLH